MEHQMRRNRQGLSTEETVEILERKTYGVLAVNGDGGYPYAVPISYVYQDGKIFFMSAKGGHKIEAITKDDHVSFCVIDEDRSLPNEDKTNFRSAIVFGRAKVLEDRLEKKRALELLGDKYAPNHEEGRQPATSKNPDHVSVIELTVIELTGKRPVELPRATEADQ